MSQTKKQKLLCSIEKKDKKITLLKVILEKIREFQEQKIQKNEEKQLQDIEKTLL